MNSASIPRQRYKLFHERCTGRLGEDRTSAEEFDEEVSSYSSECTVLRCLPIGGVRFELLVGVVLGVEYEIIRAEVGGSVYTPFFVQGRELRERAGGYLNVNCCHERLCWVRDRSFTRVSDPPRVQPQPVVYRHAPVCTLSPDSVVPRWHRALKRTSLNRCTRGTGLPSLQVTQNPQGNGVHTGNILSATYTVVGIHFRQTRGSKASTTRSKSYTPPPPNLSFAFITRNNIPFRRHNIQLILHA